MLRRRRTPEVARAEALAAARDLLIKEGPHAVTLSRVAEATGQTHSNLLHHFGTAGELQSALMASMVGELSAALDQAVAHLRSDEAAPRMLIDIVFDAFEKGGAGRLAAWIALSGNLDHLGAIEVAVKELVSAIDEKFANERGNPHVAVTSAVLLITFMAFGDAVIGNSLRDMLERERASTRKVAAFLLPKFFEIGMT